MFYFRIIITAQTLELNVSTQVKTKIKDLTKSDSVRCISIFVIILKNKTKTKWL